MSSLRGGWLHGRRAAALVFGLFVVVGLVLVFSGTVARSTDIEAEKARLQSEIERLEARVAAGAEELTFLETEAGVRWLARVQGFGQPNEELFALPANAPSPQPLVPLGGDLQHGQTRAPIDAWLDLLFGAG